MGMDEKSPGNCIICSKPALAIFNPNIPAIVYTDASREGYAGILTQKVDNIERPVAYFSRQTNTSEKNYHSFELELLTIVQTLEKFRYYLLNHEFVIFTDCNAVTNAWSKQTIVPRIARWILSLQDFNFKIKHKAGFQMQHVDALSRNFPEIEKSIYLITENDYLKEAQSMDPEIIKIKEILLSRNRENNEDIFFN